MNFILYIFIVSLIFCTDVNAYLDGGTGSIIAQLILGGFAVGGAFIKMYWYKLKSLFTRK